MRKAVTCGSTSGGKPAPSLRGHPCFEDGMHQAHSTAHYQRFFLAQEKAERAARRGI